MTEKQGQIPAKRSHQFNAAESMVLMTKDGKESRQVEIPVSLSVEDGTLTTLGMNENVGGTRKKVDGEWKTIGGEWKTVRTIAAKGYLRLAGVAGLLTHDPGEVTGLDGIAKPNNYQDKASGLCFARRQCAGYTPLGHVFRTDRTVCHDVNLYNRIDLMAKCDSKPKVVQMLPADEPKPGPGWCKYPMDEAINIWLNIGCKEGMQTRISMANKEKKALDTAQTFAERNAIKAHPSCPTEHKFFTNAITLRVKSWFTTEGTPAQLDAAVFAPDAEEKMAEAGVTLETEVETVEKLDEDHAGEVAAETGADLDAQAVSDQGGAGEDEEPPTIPEDVQSALARAQSLGITNIVPGMSADEINGICDAQENTLASLRPPLIKTIARVKKAKATTWKKLLAEHELTEDDWTEASLDLLVVIKEALQEG